MYKTLKFLGVLMCLSSIVRAKPVITLLLSKGSVVVSSKNNRINIASLKEAFSREYPAPKKHRVVIKDEAHAPLTDGQVIKGDREYQLYWLSS